MTLGILTVQNLGYSLPNRAKQHRLGGALNPFFI